ncbi:MAG: heme-binding protein [Gammaproteobacteria bacterium]|nr:heme-binding protein [Gammaproteobacteria bacterium]
MRRSMLSFPALILLSSLFSPSIFAQEPLTISVKRISMEVAMKIAQAAIDTCRKERIQIAVTVVDRVGTPQVMLRDVLTPDLAIRVSEQKAYTATVFNMATSDMEKRFTGAYSVPKDPRLIVAGGGLPLTAGGRILGGVGVSGAPSGTQDEKCAKAGVAAVQEDLDMEE